MDGRMDGRTDERKGWEMERYMEGKDGWMNGTKGWKMDRRKEK